MSPEPLDLLQPAALSDPYPCYRELRESRPAHWSPRLGMWVLTRYDDVKEVVQDSARFSVDRFGSETPREGSRMAELFRILREWAVYRDPPAHTPLRALLAQAFTSKQLAAARPRIEAIVARLLDHAAERGRLDWVSDFAFPLPATVVGTLLGVPTEDLEKIRVWSDQISDYIGGSASERNNVDEARQGLLDTCDYFRRLARLRREHPGDDLLTTLLLADERGEVLDEEQLVANCVLLLFAGHETTGNLLASGLYHLARLGEPLLRLRRDPAAIPLAVEELLRYEPPVSGTIRIATADATFHGQQIVKGDPVAAMIASANRDPSQFDEPDALDVTRDPNRHLSFGYGIHFCLGAPLARLEAQVALRELLRRFDRIEILEPPEWKPQAFFRGLKQLWVELRPGA